MRRFALGLIGSLTLTLTLAVPALAAPLERQAPAAVAPHRLVVRPQQAVLEKVSGELVTTAAERDLAEAQEVDLQAQTVTLQSQVAALQTQQTALQAQVEALKRQLASLGGRGAGGRAMSAPGAGLGPFSNARFAYGYCTWYVASWRQVSWTGNAIDWWPNARAAGMAEGQAPAVGAIEVSSASVWGHVMLVQAVYGPDSWLVTEMNYAGWNVIDQRMVSRANEPLVGFIYG
jgi:surface antigen